MWLGFGYFWNFHLKLGEDEANPFRLTDGWQKIYREEAQHLDCVLALRHQNPSVFD